MSFYTQHIYPLLVSTLGDPPPIRSLRAQLIPLAARLVLEIGAGSGSNFAHYDAARVTKLYALEPNPTMRRLAGVQQLRTALTVDYLDAPGERVPLSHQTVDSVVSTFTLCTIADVTQAIREIRRVLRSSGRLIFVELTIAPDARVRRWQRWWEPLHYRIFAGLSLSRDIPALLEQGGFRLERLEMGYLTRFPKAWAHACWGFAMPEPR